MPNSASADLSTVSVDILDNATATAAAERPRQKLEERADYGGYWAEIAEVAGSHDLSTGVDILTKAAFTR